MFIERPRIFSKHGQKIVAVFFVDVIACWLLLFIIVSDSIIFSHFYISDEVIIFVFSKSMMSMNFGCFLCSKCFCVNSNCALCVYVCACVLLLTLLLSKYNRLIIKQPSVLSICLSVYLSNHGQIQNGVPEFRRGKFVFRDRYLFSFWKHLSVFWAVLFHRSLYHVWEGKGFYFGLDYLYWCLYEYSFSAFTSIYIFWLELFVYF